MAKKEKAVASKTTMNLAVRERDLSKSPVVALPVIVIIALVAILVSWGVGTQLGRVNSAQREVDRMRDNIAQLQAGYADYDEVQEEYNRYTYEKFDRTIQDRLEVMSLMERQVYPVCSVRSFSVAGRQMSLVLEGLTLESTSALITRLNAEDMVDSVSVSVYDATSDSGATYPLTNMVIVLSDASKTEEVAK